MTTVTHSISRGQIDALGREPNVHVWRTIAIVALASLANGCAWRCGGESVPSELWYREDQPGVAWRSPDAQSPLSEVEIVRSPEQVAGGVVVVFVPETRWVVCRENDAAHVR